MKPELEKRCNEIMRDLRQGLKFVQSEIDSRENKKGEKKNKKGEKKDEKVSAYTAN